MTTKKRMQIMTVAMGLWLCSPTAAWASTYTVTSPKDCPAIDAARGCPIAATANDGTLRGALLAANSTPAPDRIEFVIPDSDCVVPQSTYTDAGIFPTAGTLLTDHSGPIKFFNNASSTPGICVIQPLADLPAITKPVVIDGFTVNEFIPSDRGPQANGAVARVIWLDGSRYTGGLGLQMLGDISSVAGPALPVSCNPSLFPHTELLPFGCMTQPTATVPDDSGGSGSTVRGLILTNFQRTAILIHGADHNVIRGNLFGMDPSETQALPNGLNGGFTRQNNIAIAGGVSNVIGMDPPPAAALDRNVLTGSSIVLFELDSVTTRGRRQANRTSNNNQIVGNYVGTRSDGTTPAPAVSTALGVTVRPFNPSSAATPDQAVRATGLGIVVANGHGNLVSGNTVASISFRALGLFAQGLPGQENQLIGNHVFQSARGIDIASDLSLPSNNIIAGNHLEDITEDGISVLAKQFKDSVISSNVMNRVGEIGIYIRTGNTFDYSSCTPNAVNDYCISQRLAAENNQISNNTILHSATGIMVIGTSVGNQITNNTVTNSMRNGIVLAGNASDNTIGGNEVGWSVDTGIALQLDSEPLASSADNLIGSNNVHDSGSANVSVGRSNIFFEQKSGVGLVAGLPTSAPVALTGSFVFRTQSGGALTSAVPGVAANGTWTLVVADNFAVGGGGGTNTIAGGWSIGLVTPAGTTTCENASPIAVNDRQPASSTITCTGVTGAPVQKLTVQLRGIKSTTPTRNTSLTDWVGSVTSPDGRVIRLFERTSPGTAFDNATITFDDTAPLTVSTGGVADHTAPVVVVPGPMVVEATGPAGAVVTFAATASDNLDATVSASCSPASASTFPLGPTTVVCRSTDTHGNIGSASFVVTVRDSTSPTILNESASESVLWPPNGKMVPVTIAVSATDVVTTAPACSVTTVSSNEPGGTLPQWVISAPLALTLQADRSGSGNGRTYTITVTCSDSAGNSSTRSTTVVVPHDQGKK